MRLQQLEASRQTQEKDVKAVRYDPFSRRWTRSRNYYVAKPPGGDVAPAANGDTSGAIFIGNGNESRAAAEAGKAATAAALQEAAGAGKLVGTSAPVDEGTESNMLHDFEILTSLNTLRKFGGSQRVVVGFLARKQRMEATVRCRVTDNDGRRHALTLTVSDYKRSRGLL
ncbi:hypothetical protein DITRI_Ditri02bG0029100 [Diplodiscus trichospermus]